MIHSGLELLVSDMYRTIFNNSRPKLKTRIAAGRLYMTDDFAKCHGRRRHLSVVAGIMAKANTGLPLRSDTRTGSKTKGYYEAWSDELFKKYPDQYPAFIMGKFVEILGNAASVPANKLNLTLIKDGFKCGWPLDQLIRQINIFVCQHGLKLAIHEPYQSSSFESASRDYKIARVYTPGTLTEEHFGGLETPRGLLSIACSPRSQTEDSVGHLYHLFSYDVSTAARSECVITLDGVRERLEAFHPAEIVLHSDILADKQHPIHGSLASFPAVLSAPVRFREASLSPNASSGSSHSLMQTYLDETLFTLAPSLSESRTHNSLAHPSEMRLEGSALSALEVRKRASSGSSSGSLLAVLKRTCTPGGAKLLAGRLCTPSTDLREIHHRLNLVTSFLYHADLRTDLRDCLKTLPDVPRLVASVQSRPSFPSLFDLEACLHLCDTIRLTTNNYAASLPDTRSAETAAIMSFFADYPIFVQLSKQIKAVRTTEDDKEDATTLYERAIQLKGTEGAKKGKEVEGAEWAVRSDYNETLKKAHFAYEACAADLDGHLVSIQRKHKLPKALHVSYDSKRKQPLVKLSAKQVQRMTDTELVTIDSNKVWAYTTSARILHLWKLKEASAQEIVQAEGQLMKDLYRTFDAHKESLDRLCAKLNELDVAMSSADLAEEQNHVCPRFVSRNVIEIVQGRHPVIESALTRRDHKAFVPNDIHLGRQTGNFVLITGPNMGGKSTVLRQVAIVVLLAQAGLYVPAGSASLSVVDQIFTRIGASDDLFQNKSTFMQEMSEMSVILRKATSRSLVLLDEVGRGTSMIDGLAISTAISQYLLKNNGPKVLFATHLHELATHLSAEHINYMCTEVIQNEEGNITFDYALRDGVNDNSHGLLTAELAGIPEEVLSSARKTSATILATQEKMQRLLEREEGIAGC